ncbi:MAG: DUF3990 domain-containing protein [Spirochaetaceae bacterium]|jgi:hypothetical protein|nr:DUF3990 domain-containing protein [Spirochaetaceae bacterium]
MLLYHGGNITIEEIELRPHNRFLDFGEGFYTTPERKQAERFAQITVDRKGGKAILNTYEYDEQKAEKLQKRLFPSANKEWLNFIVKNRRGLYKNDEYDIIIGPVANDRVYQTINNYTFGNLSIEEAITRLSTWNLYTQYVFCTQIALNTLRFIKSEEVIQNG